MPCSASFKTRFLARSTVPKTWKGQLCSWIYWECISRGVANCEFADKLFQKSLPSSLQAMNAFWSVGLGLLLNTQNLAATIFAPTAKALQTSNAAQIMSDAALQGKLLANSVVLGRHDSQSIQSLATNQVDTHFLIYFPRNVSFSAAGSSSANHIRI